jgi:hypothetical protein
MFCYGTAPGNIRSGYCSKAKVSITKAQAPMIKAQEWF